MEVPEILFSGNHEEIRKWREARSKERTLKWRKDLFEL
jgi:tRNA (guanine-N1)-methyltransferase